MPTIAELNDAYQDAKAKAHEASDREAEAKRKRDHTRWHINEDERQLALAQARGDEPAFARLRDELFDDMREWDRLNRDYQDRQSEATAAYHDMYRQWLAYAQALIRDGQNIPPLPPDRP